MYNTERRLLLGISLSSRRCSRGSETFTTEFMIYCMLSLSEMIRSVRNRDTWAVSMVARSRRWIDARSRWFLGMDGEERKLTSTSQLFEREIIVRRASAFKDAVTRISVHRSGALIAMARHRLLICERVKATGSWSLAFPERATGAN